MNHGLMEVGEKHPLWAIMSLSSLEQFGTEYSQKLDLGLDGLTVQSHQACLKQHPFAPTWSWHLHCLHWGQDFRLWFWEQCCLPVMARGGEFGIWDWELSDLEQINTNSWVYFRVGKAVFSTLCHHTCPGFLICLPCSFFLVDYNIVLTQKYK